MPMEGRESRAGSDVLALAWPESHGFGPACVGFGLMKCQARPRCLALAWPGLALAQAMALMNNFVFQFNNFEHLFY